MHYVASVPKFHIWQEKTSRPIDKPKDWKRRRRREVTQAPSVTPSLPSEPTSKAAAPPPPPPLEHCLRSHRNDRT